MVQTRRFRGGKNSTRQYKGKKHHSTHRRKVKRYSRRGTKRRRTKRMKRGGANKTRKIMVGGGHAYFIFDKADSSDIVDDSIVEINIVTNKLLPVGLRDGHSNDNVKKALEKHYKDYNINVNVTSVEGGDKVPSDGDITLRGEPRFYIVTINNRRYNVLRWKNRGDAQMSVRTESAKDFLLMKKGATRDNPTAQPSTPRQSVNSLTNRSRGRPPTGHQQYSPQRFYSKAYMTMNAAQKEAAKARYKAETEAHWGVSAAERKAQAQADKLQGERWFGQE